MSMAKPARGARKAAPGKSMTQAQLLKDFDVGKIRDILRRVACTLSAMPARDELSPLVASAFFCYLNGKAKTLDSAFGLIKRGPKKRNYDRDLNIAKAVCKFKNENGKRTKIRKRFLTTLGEDYGLKGSQESIVRQVEQIASDYKTQAAYALGTEDTYARRRNPK